MQQNHEKNVRIAINNVDEDKEQTGAEHQPPTESKEKAESESNYLDLLQHLKADFDNYRRRTIKEKEDLAEFIRGNLIEKLLPVLDDFERLLQTEGNDGRMKDGANLIYNNLISILKQFGLEGFADEGKEFDPNIHEAMMVENTTDENDGKIMDVWQKGYRLKDRLLRPAKVKVGQAPGKGDE